MPTATAPSATGRRKNAVAHVWISEGTGSISINGRPFDDYLPTAELQNAILQPFQQTSLVNKFDVKVVASGGGIHGQAGAIRMAIARALNQHDIALRKLLKPAGMLRRDPRMKERKKPGRPGARKRFQFSKR